MKFYNIHTHNYSNDENIIEIVNQFPQKFDAKIHEYSIGIHPWYINENLVVNDLQIIEEKLKIKYCLALGECGLDKKIDISLQLQISIFEQQLLLAKKYSKPVIVHCVAAFQEIIEIKNSLNFDLPTIIHGFSKNIQTANQLLDTGFYLSFGKNLILNPELKAVFNLCPDNKFFLETDSSDYSIQEIYLVAAKYKNISIENLKNIINTNFETVFKF